MTRDYELGFILNPEVSEEQTRAILDRVEQVVANHGGQVMKVNPWGRRRLAYPIERHRDGIYIFVDMILAPETVSELDRTLKVSEEVLRHLIKKRDSRAVQKEREEREARAAAAQAQPASRPEVEEEAEVPVSEEEAGESVALPTDELVDVPPAIEGLEETVEA